MPPLPTAGCGIAVWACWTGREEKLRRESNLSQEKLAEQINVSRQAVSKWELGTAAPDVDNVVRLSNFFQVPLAYLMLEECEDPAEGAAPREGNISPEGAVPAGGTVPAEEAKPLCWWRPTFLGLLIGGVAMEILSYGLCYPMQEREWRMFGECYTDPTEYMTQMPLYWLTLVGGFCLAAAAYLLVIRWCIRADTKG